MKTDDSLDLQVKEILKEATEASNIVIYCEKSIASNSKPKVKEILVVSINGFTTINEFDNYFQKIGETIEKQAMQIQGNASIGLKTMFMNGLRNSIRELQCKVIKESNTDVSVEFTKPVVMIGNVVCSDQAVNDTVNEIVKKYATALNDAFLRIMNNLTVLETITHYLGGNQTCEVTKAESKIEVGLSIPKFSLFSRMLYDRGIFGNVSRLEVIRLMTTHFRTTKNIEISANSFRNHFNIPDAESLAFWDDFFADLRDEIKNYYRKYHSS